MAGADRVGYGKSGSVRLLQYNQLIYELFTETHPYLAFAVDYFDESSYRDSITRVRELKTSSICILLTQTSLSSALPMVGSAIQQHNAVYWSCLDWRILLGDERLR